MSRDTYIRAPYRLDPLIPLDKKLADRLYGRVVKIGASGRPTPWVFLMRNMYGVLVGELSKQGHEVGKRSPKSASDVKRLAGATVRNWAMAFNIAIKTQHQVGTFKKPRAIDKEKNPSTWEPPLVLMMEQATKDKYMKYAEGEARFITNKILKIMDDYRERVYEIVSKDPELQDITE